MATVKLTIELPTGCVFRPETVVDAALRLYNKSSSIKFTHAVEGFTPPPKPEPPKLNDGEQPPKAAKKTQKKEVERLDCKNRGELVGATLCETCGGGVALKVYQCSEFGTCTISNKSKDVPGCCNCAGGCPKYVSKAPPPDQPATPDHASQG